MPVKAVAHSIPADAPSLQEGIEWFEADLLAAASLDAVLSPGDVVCNLAYMSAAGEAANATLVANIIEACVRTHAARLVHCSTAVVAGAVTQSRVLESSPCVPSTSYERTKWLLEQQVVNAVARGLDTGILRPTAIIGPGGQNLVKLARSLRGGSRIVNYLRASLFGKRPMHLVPVRNVAEALLHLATLPDRLNGNIYHVSSDDDPENNFATVEKVLSQALGVRPRGLPLLPVPAQVLSLLLGLAGRSETDSARIYDSRKLHAAGFKPTDSVVRAVREFGESFPPSELASASGAP